jgi:hypothetical protein
MPSGLGGPDPVAPAIEFRPVAEKREKRSRARREAGRETTNPFCGYNAPVRYHTGAAAAAGRLAVRGSDADN